VIAANPSVPARVKQLLQHAAANPGKLSYASPQRNPAIPVLA
jgi:ABC-type uncharacterized transport system YnjBCD substrate-binding protein